MSEVVDCLSNSDEERRSCTFDSKIALLEHQTVCEVIQTNLLCRCGIAGKHRSYVVGLVDLSLRWAAGRKTLSPYAVQKTIYSSYVTDQHAKVHPTERPRLLFFLIILNTETPPRWLGNCGLPVRCLPHTFHPPPTAVRSTKSTQKQQQQQRQQLSEW